MFYLEQILFEYVPFKKLFNYYVIFLIFLCSILICFHDDPNLTNEITEYTIISKNWKYCDVSNTLSTYSPSVHSLNEMIQNIYF